MAKAEASSYKNTSLNVAVDNGNSRVKFCFGSLTPYYEFPNVVRPTDTQRKTILNQGNPINYLDVEIMSPALKENGGHFYVGDLAARNSGGKSIIGFSAAQMKAKRPQTLITSLTAMAYAVASANHAQIRKGTTKFRAEINLGIGLPINEVGEIEEFSNRLLAGTHTVTFVTTPKFGGVTVELQINLPAGISIDDVTGMIDVAAEKDESFYDKAFGVADIGGVDMDIAYFRPGLQLDDDASGGTRVNLNERIAQIRNEFNNSVGQTIIESDAKLVEMLAYEKYDVMYTGKKIGNIQPTAEKHLKEVAETVYENVLDGWANMPDAEEFHFIGGGSVILQKYIRDMADGRTLVFDNPALSRFRNLRGNYRSLELALGATEVAAVSEDE